MKFRKSLLVALCAASLGGVAVPMTASAEGVAVYFNTAPPAARYEAVPAARRGYVWAPGYWNAKNDRHVWKAGHWEKDRKGYHYTQSTWVQQDNRWQLHQGGWNKGDRDHDGVPNSVDRAPNDPTRR
jgi:hypothetical protein